MSSSSPAVLPISNSKATAPLPSITSAHPEAPISTPAFRAFLNQVSQSLRSGFAQRRPWLELVERSSFSRPDSFSDAAIRVRKNYSYFKVNYLSLIAIVLAISLVSHPFSLLVLAVLLASWIFLYLFRPSDQPVVIFGRSFSDRETLGILILFSAVVIFLTSVGSVLVSALMAGLAIVFVHGAFRAPEDLFMDEQLPAASSFFSFIGGAATNAAAAAATPVITGRV